MSKPQAVYHSQAIKDWENRWFAHNSSYGLMQQAALALAHKLVDILHQKQLTHTVITVWCGTGNNGGDGYLLAHYLNELLDDRHYVQVFAPFEPQSTDAKRAKADCLVRTTSIFDELNWQSNHHIHIDALFGNGLNKPLSSQYQKLITRFNACFGFKIALDIPSGLHPDTGIPLPICTTADMTFCVMGLKIGLYTGVSKAHTGKIINLPLIPSDIFLTPCAYVSQIPTINPRNPTAHKGDFGTVAVIGGHPEMGGAVIMASTSAMAVGTGKVTAICHQKHHTAIITNTPNVMVADIQSNFSLTNIDGVCFGMGLGRDDWSLHCYQKILPLLMTSSAKVVLDADALYFLAQYPQKLPSHWICTPHAREAGRLLNVSANVITNDRLYAVHQLHERFGGIWVLKGANTLTYDGNRVSICPFGNAGMATAGMGDVLAGMLAGLDLPASDVVALHALAGDELAKHSPIGLNAHQMSHAICSVLGFLSHNSKTYQTHTDFY